MPVIKPRSEAATAASQEDPRQGDPFYRLTLAGLFGQFKQESFAFKMICCYLFVEYVRPQSILPWLDFLPWAQVFLAATAVGLLTGPRQKWVSDPANVYMTLLLLVLILSSVYAEYPAVSFSHWFDFFGWYVIYFLIIHTVTTERRFIIFLVIFLTASLKLSFFGARTWAGRGFSFTNWGIAGPPGFFQNSGELAIQMLMAAPIAYYFAKAMQPYLSRAKYWLIMSIPLTATMTVAGASSRGAQIGLAAQGAWVLIRERKSLKVMLAVVVMAASIYLLLPDEQLMRFQSIGTDRTSEQRILYWKHGIEMIAQHPVLGVGFYNFSPYYTANFPQDILFNAAQMPHNIFIQVGTDAGFTGLFVFIMIIIRNLNCSRQISRLANEMGRKSVEIPELIARGLSVAMVGYVVAGQFVTVTYYPFPWINLALTVALLNIARGSRPAKNLETA